MRRSSFHAGLVAPLLVIAVGPSIDRAAAIDEFHAYLLPETTRVEVDDTFVVTFSVDSTATSFNAYEAVFSWDAGTVELVDYESGDLMNVTGCPPPWLVALDAADSFIVISHSVICSGVSLDGPGELLRLIFRASAVGITDVVNAGDPDRTFIDAGLWIFPGNLTDPRQVVFHDALVIAYDPTLAIQPAGATQPPPVRFVPNPSSGSGEIRFDPGGARAVSIGIFDASGRRIWRRRLAAVPMGGHRLWWPGRDEQGRVVPSGIYYVRIDGGDGGRIRAFVIAR